MICIHLGIALANNVLASHLYSIMSHNWLLANNCIAPGIFNISQLAGSYNTVAVSLFSHL